QFGARGRIGPERVSQQGHRAQPRRAGWVAFQVADGFGAEPGPLGQALLSQPGGQSLALEQRPEAGRPPRCHRPYLPGPRKKGGNGESASCRPPGRPSTLGSGQPTRCPGSETMAPDELKTRARRVVEEILNQGDFAVANELISPD